jgi:threonylcarbamoyladenosine tRNA methylthiotransferase MtaB
MAMREALEDSGFSVVRFEPGAKIYIINTCTVTSRSDYKGRQTVRRALRIKPPDGLVVVTGCQSQLNPGEFINLGADLVIGNVEKSQIVTLIKESLRERKKRIEIKPVHEMKEFQHMPLHSFPGYSRAFLKVQDGCNNRCTYCSVWMARGPARSANPSWVLEEAKKLVSHGYEELILTGINLGAYRWKEWSLSHLLEALLSVNGLERIRLSSIEPQEFTPNLKKLILQEERIAPHLHIPMQSGDDKVLKLMGRSYTREIFAQLVEELAQSRKSMGIGVDVMVGFPGEDDRAFENTKSLLKALPIYYMHIFTYSPRPHTQAAAMEYQVPPEAKAERYQQLKILKEEKILSFRRSHIGKPIKVLLEGRRDLSTDLPRGISENYIPFIFLEKPKGKRGKYINAFGEKIISNLLAGKAVR